MASEPTRRFLISTDWTMPLRYFEVTKQFASSRIISLRMRSFAENDVPIRITNKGLSLNYNLSGFELYENFMKNNES